MSLPFQDLCQTGASPPGHDASRAAIVISNVLSETDFTVAF